MKRKKTEEVTIMKPTDILSDEHKKILKVADALNKECLLIDKGKNIDKNFFEKAIDFIRNYADKFHHAKEEDILFVELNKPGVMEHCNPVSQMLYEHDIGRGFVKGVIEALNKSDRKKIVENARGYVQLIQEHIWKEDNILYPMANEGLISKMQELILKKFKEAENKKLKDKARYLELAEEFEKRK